MSAMHANVLALPVGDQLTAAGTLHLVGVRRAYRCDGPSLPADVASQRHITD
jgi:hypothetical protein